EPADLAFVVGVVYRDEVGIAVGVAQADLQRLAGGEGRETEDVDLVVFFDEVVIGLVSEGEGQHPLLLEVGFVDAGEAFHQHGAH
nr:hypothetical protein [Tanacetum cinerariifolium]